ncbi:MAG: hypothetical protein KDE59_24575 [Anaerolineales bacterium]|nr:hypothetical protein [Anaerolineales bacterium]
MPNKDEFDNYLTQLGSDPALNCVMYYPHPFTEGGLILVYDRKGEQWLKQVSAAEASRQRHLPRLQLHCHTPATLGQLSNPGMFTPPLQINEMPHLPYWLAARGRCLWGADLRHLVQPFPEPAMLLAGHVEGCFDYLRRYGILMSLVQERYAQLAQLLQQEMACLLGTALLVAGVWDVSWATVAGQFREAYPAQLANDWYELAVAVEVAVDRPVQAQKEQTIRLVFYFEQFLKSLRDGFDN